MHQAIALFRYQLASILNKKFLLVTLIIFIVGVLLSGFIHELAIIKSDNISLAFMADFLRYSLSVLLIISISHLISQDYELKQMDYLLALPISRSQYIFAQTFVLLMVFQYYTLLFVYLPNELVMRLPLHFHNAMEIRASDMLLPLL